MHKHRIDLSKDDYLELMDLLSKAKLSRSLNDSMNGVRLIKNSDAKKNATKKATRVRTKIAKDKIQNAINILRLENRAITTYSVAQEAGVSYNTVKKYMDF